MPENTSTMDLLFAMRDVGVAEPVPDDAGDIRARTTLQREILQASRPGRNRDRWIDRRVRRAVVVPVALLLTTAAAAAATGIVNPFQVAHDNATDAPTRLFENNPAVTGASPAALWHQTVIASTVRNIESFTLSGVGRVQYWVADTRQHGYCTALRLPEGTWVGLQHNGRVGGEMPGCRPTRQQVGGGALGLDGFDYAEDAVIGRGGQRWMIEYGVVSARAQAARVRDVVSGVSVPILDGRYFAIALHPQGGDWGDHSHLQALDGSGREVAQQG